MDAHHIAYNYIDDIESDLEKPVPPPHQPPLIDLSEIVATTILSDESKDSFLSDDLDNLTDLFDPSKESTDFNESSVSPDHVVLCGDKYRVRHRSALSSCEILELEETDNSITTNKSQPRSALSSCDILELEEMNSPIATNKSQHRSALSSCGILELEDMNSPIATTKSQPMTSTPITTHTQAKQSTTPNNNSFLGESRFNDSLTNLLGSPHPQSSFYNNPFFNDLQAVLASDCISSKESLPQSLFDALTTEPNSNVFSREQSIQDRFNKLSCFFPEDVQKLSEFYHQQASDVETERFCALQQKKMTKDAKYAMNLHYDNQLHQIMDRVEQSLLLLEKTQQMNYSSRQIKLRPLLSKKAVQLMESWYDNHLEHPYPNPDAIDRLSAAGGVTAEQVKKWFANKRNRSNNTRSLTEIAKKKRQLALNTMDCFTNTSCDI